MVTLYTASAYITFDSSECRSLKEKRSAIRSLMDKAKNHFTAAAFAEVGDADQTQRFSIGFSVIANDETLVRTMLDKIIQYLEENSFRSILQSHAEIYAL